MIDLKRILTTLTFLFGVLCVSFSQKPEGRFVPNVGQIPTIEHKPNSEVLFSVENQQISITPNSIVYTTDNKGAHFLKQDSIFKDRIDHLNFDTTNFSFSDHSKYECQQVRMTFLNANEEVKIKYGIQASDYLNVYNGASNGVFDKIPLYKDFEVTEMLEGISVKYYFKGTDLKYDIIVDPYADPSELTMSWQGADTVFLRNSKELSIRTKFKEWSEQIPMAYQVINGQIVSIPIHYEIQQNGSIVLTSFNLGDYDKSLPLVIDPWVTNYGGDAEDLGIEVTVDEEGFVYMTGSTESIAAMAEDGFQMVYGTGIDAFLAKFSPEGERMWATYYGGTGEDRGMGVVIDSEGDVYMGGATKSGTGIATPGTFQPTYSGGSFDGFLVKFDSDGSRLWGTYYGQESEDFVMNIGVDEFDHVYMGGYTLSESGLAADGHQDFFGGFTDAFLVRFTPDGDRDWATYYGGIYAEIIHDIHCDGFGHVYVGGVTTSPDLISTPGTLQPVHGGGQDAFIVKFEVTGEREWGSYFGQLWVERGDAVTTDDNGDVYLVGKTTAPDGTATEDAFQTEIGGYSDAFILKLDSNCFRYWSTYIGGDYTDYAFAADIDPITQDVVVFGETSSSDFPVSPCATNDELMGDKNAFVSRFTGDGDLVCSSYYGVVNEEENVGAVHDCWVYIVGTTQGAFEDPDAHQPFSGGEKDAFLSRVHLASCEDTIPDLIEFEQTQINVTSCDPCNGEATIDISSFCLLPDALKSYSWSNGHEETLTTSNSSTIDGLCGGTYWVVVTLNCDQVDTFYFDIENEEGVLADFDVNPATLEACVGDVFEFENTSVSESGEISSVLWSFGDGDFSGEENPTHVFESEGIYEVQLTVGNDFECEDSLIKMIEIFPDYEINMDTSICSGQEYLLPNGEWLTVENNVSLQFDLLSVHGCDSLIDLQINVLENDYSESEIEIDSGETYFFNEEEYVIHSDTTFTDQLLNASGCDSTIMTHLIVIPPPIDTLEVSTKLVVPNIFSPDNDMANNTFFFPSENVGQFECIITNRWGQVVFRFDDIEDQWIGTHWNGESECPEGVYFYHYTGKFENNKPFKGQGTVQLVRRN